eukprot:XP_014027026.1 PREDICTED: uncharacterized protein LOC106585398 isoform X2 [Salmo salar]
MSNPNESILDARVAKSKEEKRAVTAMACGGAEKLEKPPASFKSHVWEHFDFPVKYDDGRRVVDNTITGQATEPTEADSEASPQNHSAMKELFGETFASKDTGKTFANTIKEEVASSVIPLDGDPLAWWKSNECKYPHIAMMARCYLAVPGTSDPSERVFSTAEDIVTAKRSSLSPDNVDILIFLKNNFKFQLRSALLLSLLFFMM